ncbi:MAG TPA: peptidylprolyl isomerase [Chthoniobacterales bacterium]|jgi:cyclophilin family peptidyl-prolyl cis-trans isomerase
MNDTTSKPADAQYLDRKDPIVRVEVPAGDVYLELFPDAAPKHVERILLLAGEGFYDGIRFHRIVPDFVAQVGDPKTKNGVDVPGAGSGGSTYPNLPLEVSKAYKNSRGSLAAARTNDPNSANSQFYIVLKDAPHLDMQYTVFGRVLGDGMKVVDQIKRGDAMKMVIVKK